MIENLFSKVTNPLKESFNIPQVERFLIPEKNEEIAESSVVKFVAKKSTGNSTLLRPWINKGGPKVTTCGLFFGPDDDDYDDEVIVKDVEGELVVRDTPFQNTEIYTEKKELQEQVSNHVDTASKGESDKVAEISSSQKAERCTDTQENIELSLHSDTTCSGNKKGSISEADRVVIEG